MASVFVNVLVVLLTAAFAIASIIAIFAVAGHVFNEIFEAFQRSMLAGVGVLSMSAIVLAAVVFGVRMAIPYVVEFYRQVTG